MIGKMKQKLLKAVLKPRGERRFRALLAAGRVTMGRHSYGIPEVVIFGGDPTRLRIGNYVSIGQGVQLLLGGNHRIDWVTTFPLRKMLGLPGAGQDGHPSSKGDVVVGNDVWLGLDAKILSGVVIGDGAVVGAYATVTRSVRPYAIVAGSPAREVRRRLSDEQIEGLLKGSWWNWSDNKVRDEVQHLSSANIDEFLARHDS